MENKMNVLLVKPGKHPERVSMDSGLESLQKAVGGYIEVVYPFEEPVAIIVDEEGKCKGKEANRGLFLENGRLYDVICGDFLVVGLGEDDFESLSPELMELFEQKFHQPETFMRVGHNVVAIPIYDD